MLIYFFLPKQRGGYFNGLEFAGGRSDYSNYSIPMQNSPLEKGYSDLGSICVSNKKSMREKKLLKPFFSDIVNWQHSCF